jgi:putative restriction endonuclease
LRIHVIPEIERRVASDPAVGAAFGRPPLGERLLLPKGAATPLVSYLVWHNKNVYAANLAP